MFQFQFERQKPGRAGRVDIAFALANVSPSLRMRAAPIDDKDVMADVFQPSSLVRSQKTRGCPE
jgi:hypothetical protein